jgi:HK97 family phage portal protein
MKILDKLKLAVSLFAPSLVSKSAKVGISSYSQFQKTFAGWLENISGSDRNTGYVASCANIWGLSFAKAKHRLYDKTPARSGTAGGGMEVLLHPFNDLMSKPNWFQTSWEQRYRIATDFIYEGNSYFLKLRDSLRVPRALVQLHPERVTTQPYNYEKIDYYEYNTGSDIIRLEKEDILHFRLPSLSSYIKGTPLLAKIADVRDIEKLQIAYRKQFYKQGGFLGAVFTTEQKMNSDVFKRAKSELEKNYAGSVENSFKVALFEQGLKPIPTAYSPKDMDMTAERNLNKEEILSVFGVNKLLFGQSEQIQRGNADTVYYVFYATIIDPLLDYIDEVFTSQLCHTDFDSDYFVKHDTLAGRDVELDLRYYESGLQNGWLTPDEVRELEGFEKLNDK